MAIDPRDPEFLLERSERVRALARHLLALPDGAEDVAQDALVASLGWTDSGDETLPARLAAQVRSLAGRWRRANARRTRREAAAARPDRAPSADELCERAALQRTLVEAVLALEEPYRECVILRWFEGLPPRAIAELRSLPVRTVQTRLARALAQLRARLARRVDLSAWVPLLAPLAVQPTTSLPFPSSALGVLAMATSKWAASLCAVAVLGAAVFVLRSGGFFATPGPGPIPAQGPQPSTDASDAAVATHEVDVPELTETRASVGPASAASAPTADPLPDRDLDLFGEVVDVFDQPLAGVELNALEPQRESFLSACERPEGGVVLASTLSNAEGHFRIRLDRGQTCTLEARLPGLAGARLLERRAGERVRVVLGPPAALWGRVLRAGDGSGVAGAQIMLRTRSSHVTHWMICRESESDADGSYAFEELPAGTYDVWVKCADDPGMSESALVLTPGQSRELDFVVAIGVDVSGRVRDAATGEPIAEAEVSLHPFFERSSRTAVDGSFLLRGWDAQTHGVWVHARAAGYALGGRELHKGDIPEGEIEIALAADAGVTGRILDPRGAPQADAIVDVHGSGFAPGERRDRASALSGSDGRFELRGLSRGQAHTLVASAPGAGRLIVDLPDFDPARDPRDLGDLDLPVASSLAGRVVDAAGQPFPGAYVTLEGGDPGRRRLRGLEEALLNPVTPTIVLRLDDLGRFRAKDLSPGEYRLGAHVTGRFSEEQTPVSLREGEQREGVELVLDLGLRIAGTVVGPEGEPIALAMIDAVPTGKDAGVRAGMNTRADGSFDLAGLTEGDYVLSVAHFERLGGRRYCDARVEGVAAGTLDLRIVLPNAAPISGVVLSADGEPLADGSVQIDHGDGRVGGVAATRTDALGRFRLLVPEGVPVDLLAADWTRLAEGASAVRLGRAQGVEPGTSDLTIRIEP